MHTHQGEVAMTVHTALTEFTSEKQQKNELERENDRYWENSSSYEYYMCGIALAIYYNNNKNTELGFDKAVGIFQLLNCQRQNYSAFWIIDKSYMNTLSHTEREIETLTSKQASKQTAKHSYTFTTLLLYLNTYCIRTYKYIYINF